VYCDAPASYSTHPPRYRHSHVCVPSHTTCSHDCRIWASRGRVQLMSTPRISADVLSKLHHESTPILKPKGSVLFRAGQPVRGAFIIRSGRVTMKLDRSTLCPARTVGAGTIVGLPATFSGEPYSLTAELQTDCKLDFVPRARLLSLLRNNPEVGFQIVRMLSEEIFQMRKAAKTNPSTRTRSH
jgi:CRP-like cAMP-binding protein